MKNNYACYILISDIQLFTRYRERMPKRCIFCGSQGRLSKEHFWPKWFGKLLIKKGVQSYISESFAGEGKQAALAGVRKSERQGDLTTMKFRIVCKSCNGGWMSQHEQSVKPILLDLMNGNRVLSTSDAKIIAIWASMKVMVAEFSDSNTVLTPDSDRKHFSQTFEIPDYYSVFIGFHGTDAHAGYLRHSNTLSKTVNGPIPVIPKECFINCQVVSFLIGTVVIQVVSKRIDNLSPNSLKPEKYVAEIWPSTKGIANIELLPIMSKNELYKLAHWMGEVLKNPRVKYGGAFRRGF